MVNFYSCHQVVRTLGLRGGVGASPPARGSTPARRPKLGGYSDTSQLLHQLYFPCTNSAYTVDQNIKQC